MARQTLYTIFTTCALFFQIVAHAQTPCAAPTAIAKLNANNIRAYIRAGGNLFNDGTDGHFLHVDPATSVVSPTTIYTASMWMGGIDPGGNIKLNAGTNGSGLWPGPINPDGTTNEDDCANWDKVFLVNGADIAAMLAQLPGLSAG